MEPTWLDDRGRPVLISQGIGRGKWSIYRRKPSGSLARLKHLASWETPEEAQDYLDLYATEKGWTAYRGADK